MKNFFLYLLILSLTLSTAFAQNSNIDKPIDIRLRPQPQSDSHGSDTPQEDRGPKYKEYLAPSLKVAVDAGSGSGTIIYYDSFDNFAYVATCGHLWTPGVMTAEQAKSKKVKCNVIVWYKNGKKLNQPSSYEAELLFYSYVDGCDTALIRFSPDYQPEYFSFGPKDYIYQKDCFVHSMGCDGAREVAHYEVQIVGIQGKDLITTKNSPRPGRSGGGLVDNNKTYIGTCWGTSKVDGSGNGYFTPLSIIHSFWEKNGYGFLLLNKDVKKIKIYDRNLNRFVEDDLILLPQSQVKL